MQLATGGPVFMQGGGPTAQGMLDTKSLSIQLCGDTSVEVEALLKPAPISDLQKASAVQKWFLFWWRLCWNKPRSTQQLLKIGIGVRGFL